MIVMVAPCSSGVLLTRLPKLLVSDDGVIPRTAGATTPNHEECSPSAAVGFTPPVGRRAWVGGVVGGGVGCWWRGRWSGGVAGLERIQDRLHQHGGRRLRRHRRQG